MHTLMKPRGAMGALGWVAAALMLFAAGAEGAFAYSQANWSAALVVNGWTIPTDVVVKTAFAVGCGLVLVLGAPIIAVKLRADSKKQYKEAMALLVGVILAYCICVANFAGYFGHNRFQAATARFHATEEYKTTAADLTSSNWEDRREARRWIAEHAPQPGAVFGDYAKAALLHGLILLVAFGSAPPYQRASRQDQQEPRQGRRRRNGRKKEPRTKPTLVAVK